MQTQTSYGNLYLGDCLEILPTLADSSIDMVCCDLPYGTTHNKWDSVIPLDRLWEEYRRVCKPNSAIVLFSQGVFTAKLICSNLDAFKFKYVWVKGGAPTGFLNANRQPLRQHEDICVFSHGSLPYHPVMWQSRTPYKSYKRKNRSATSNYSDYKTGVVTHNKGDRHPTDVIYAQSRQRPRMHPTQKPTSLCRWLIRTYTNEKDVILDNAFGSGTTLVAAKMENRKFEGMELEPQYYDGASERINGPCDARDFYDDAVPIGSFLHTDLMETPKKNMPKATLDKVLGKG